MYLVVGLGNPGEEYAATRHNLGFMVVEQLCRNLGVETLKPKFSSFMAALEFSGRKVILAMPQTFMNRSGEAVAAILAWHKIDAKRLILIYDDVDLEIGEVKIREKGSSAGHKGVQSVITSLCTSEFIRVRLGIGRETASDDITDYVLSKIPPAQMDKIEPAIEKAAQAVLAIIRDGVEPATQELNRG
ncbi:MAG: aminoacyl-tRNA hydrolase [Candidatus Margulisiibacteriota bacterium]